MLRDHRGGTGGQPTDPPARSDGRPCEEEGSGLPATIEKVASEWRRTVDAVDMPIFLLDHEGRLIRMNQAARNLTGRSYHENLGRRVADLGFGEPWLKMAELTQRALTNHSQEYLQVQDPSRGRTWEVTATHSALGGHEDRIIIVVRDITRMEELRESLRRNETMSAMGWLLGRVAHEVRNPIFGISATIDALEARFGNRQEFSQFFYTLRLELDRMTRLVNELLDYGRPLHLELTSGFVEDVVAQAIGSLEGAAKRAAAKVVQANSTVRAPVRMDKDRLVQAFRNLVGNAIQHSPPEAEVVVEIERLRQEGQDWIACNVKDSGPGFRREDLSRIFQPFYSRRKGGTGLGLAIAQRIVEEHGGKIEAGNRPEGGGVIRVRLPRAG